MAGIAALGAVLAALEEGGFRTHAQLAGAREQLAQALRQAFPGIVFNMPFAHSLPTTLNFSVPGLSSGDLLDLFDAAGVRVSAGSACSASKAAPSYVLEAMGLPPWRSGAAVRMSFGPLDDDAFIAAACARIEHCGAALRGDGLAPSGAVEAGLEAELEAGPEAGLEPELELQPAALEAYLLSHPDARLIDVREAFEHRAGGAPAWLGRGFENVPLSRLPQQIAGWLGGEQHPLVFFCRSGKRSARAAQWMVRLGYRNAWHLAGGLALR
jgi:cysteine desulfurase